MACTLWAFGVQVCKQGDVRVNAVAVAEAEKVAGTEALHRRSTHLLRLNS